MTAGNTSAAASGPPATVGGPAGTEPGGPVRRASHRAKGSGVAWWNTAVVVLPGLAILVLGYSRRFITDDGLIFTRAVREILAGNGPVFSPGERAESSTSTLWQWGLAAVAWVSRIDPARLAVYGGLLLTVAGFVLALQGTRRLHENADSALLLPAGVLVLLVLPPVWDFATSGLETGLITCWLGSCWVLLVRGLRAERSGRLLFLGAAFFGLGPLVRPDLALVSAVFLLAWWLLLRPTWRRSLLALAAAAALPLAYEIFRMGYYGLLVPLPALTKESGASEWGRGWTYTRYFLSPYLLYLSLPIAGVALIEVVRMRWQRRDQVVVMLAPVAAGAALGLYVLRVGGDWMHARMLLAPLFLGLLPVLVLPATRRTIGLVALLAVWAAALIGPMRPPNDPQARLEVNVHRLGLKLTGTAHPVSEAQWVRAFPKLQADVAGAPRGPGPVLLAGAGNGRLTAIPAAPAPPGQNQRQLIVVGGYLGVTGVLVPDDQRVVDVLSLAYPLGAHFEYRRGLLPGHEKFVSNAWILGDYAAPDADLSQLGTTTSPASVAAARHALSCGQLKELQDSVRQPMTPGRFWHNLIGSPRRTVLRVPRDPMAAERQFCG